MWTATKFGAKLIIILPRPSHALSTVFRASDNNHPYHGPVPLGGLMNKGHKGQRGARLVGKGRGIWFAFLVLVTLLALVVPVWWSSSKGDSVAIEQEAESVSVTRFANGRVDIRSGPGAGHEVINYLADEQVVLVGSPDQHGWVPVLDPVGDTVGFVWAESLIARPGVGGRRRVFEIEGLVIPAR